MKTFLDKHCPHSALMILAFVLTIAPVTAAPVTTDGALILERANSNENIYSNATGEFISYLRGDVVFLYEDMRIAADEATWQKNRGIIDFRKNVKAEQAGQVITCERLHFVKDNNLLTASGKVFYEDSAKITFINGTNAEYRTDTKVATLWGNPVLTRLDSTQVDTLIIRGRTMKYNDSLKIATVIDNVSITQGELTATCRNADYFVNTSSAQLRRNPVILYEKHRVVGDSVDLFFDDKALKSAVVMGNAHGIYTEAADSTKDTTVTKIWSDSLHLTMFESGKMSSMKAFRNARGSYVETAEKKGDVTITNIASDSIFMFMFETGKIRSMTAYSNARGDYSETSASGSAMNNNITSDSIRVSMFETGKIRSMLAYGNARCDYSESSVSSGRRSTMTTNITSDSMRVLMFETGKIRSVRAYGSAHGRSSEWGANSQDSMITHIWSDSLRVTMSETGKIKTMKAFVDVLSQNFLLADSAARASEISGQTMTLAFGQTGKIEQALVRGDAKSNYYLTEKEGGGQNVAAGDQIHVTFAAGKAQRLRVRGNVKGYYAPGQD